jgi:putative acetyltransferase
MTVRKAEAADLPAIRKIHDAAFGGPGEAKLVADLVAAGLDAISLVALAGPEIIGHILFSPLLVELNGAPIRALALAPLGVAPAHQRRGFGSTLTLAGLAEARESGWEAVIVLGHPEYYASLGFRADLASGFLAPFQGPAFMGLELREGALSGAKGRIIYPVSFGIADPKRISAGP